MLDYKEALDLMRKYGYMSTSTPPYLYHSNNHIGVFYRYYDRDYGYLDRIKVFDTMEAMDSFLARLKWLNENGSSQFVRMVLDNYEIANPKNIFLRFDRTMEKGEMFQLELSFQKKQEESLLDPVSKLVLEAGRMLVYYDEVKAKRIALSKTVLELDNELRTRYFKLQQEIDCYNKVKVKRELVLVPILEDTDGINLIMENSIKERYIQYKSTLPSLEEAKIFIQEIWSLLSNLEEYPKYFYHLQKERELYNEMRVVQEKLEFVEKLNREEKKSFASNLMKEFRRINHFYKNHNLPIEKDFVESEVKAVERKYSSFYQLDIFHITDYLKESAGNYNYGELLFKYDKDRASDLKTNLTSKQISSHLFSIYKKELSVDEQAILLLYHSECRELLDYLLSISDIFSLKIELIIEKMKKDKKFFFLKRTYYDYLKRTVLYSSNASIKQSVFKNINFTNFSLFIESLIHSLSLLKNINSKMKLGGELVMYSSLDQISSLSNKHYLYLKQDVTSIQASLTKKDQIIAILHLTKDTPVLFCPYSLKLGINSKDKLSSFQISYMKEFNLFIDLDDVIIERDATTTAVSQYESFAEEKEGVVVVKKVKLRKYYQYIKMFLHTNLLELPKSIKGGDKNEGNR